MPESFNNLAGGFLQGFVGSKNKAREMGMMEEYRKAATEHIKTQAKLDEQKINLAFMKEQAIKNMPETLAGLDAVPPGAAPAVAPQARPMAQPFAQFQPQAAPQAAPQGIPNMVAAGQMPFLAGPVSGLAPDLTTRLAAMGQEFYNTTGQPLKITDGFRTTAQQADVYARKPNLAVPPGHSQHEKGLAVDVDNAQVPLLEQTGLLEKYGFTRPALAGKGETWHLELGPQGGGLRHTSAGNGASSPKDATVKWGNDFDPQLPEGNRH